MKKEQFVEYPPVSDEQLGFFIDSSICSGCKTCQVACKDKNNLEVGRLFRRVSEFSGGRFKKDEKGAFSHDVYAYTLSIACNHCKEPICVKNCPPQAMHKRKGDGIVRVNTDLCIACNYCAQLCPYGAPQMDKKYNQMSKCDMCVDLLAEDQGPICVDACPLNAIQFGPIRELREKYGTLAEVKDMPPSTFTYPNLVIKPNERALEK